MAEEEPVTQEEEVEQTTPFLATEGNDKANLVLALASSILFDGSAEFTAENLNGILAASNNQAPAAYTEAFAALLSAGGPNEKMFEFKVGGGGGGGSAASGAGAAAAEEAKEPEPESEEEEVVVSFGDADAAW
eukprot:CAMPEP_0195517246 /NCGR_PEP_ID=MMETSP0794_2-20130614/10261_1 /TAXON_ID=515487 /ORGANISM="Stephanopyxis turris, Strain CCMP 815" /LENGTH=132 /DNA_ID=CAMNT_0040646021 /DNA_START=78 /DNA_END=476 /DNA_ORIENTATION=-